MISFVAKDSATDVIRSLARLNKEASACNRKPSESIVTYVERFFDAAQSYLNLISADRSSAESQNLAKTLVSNENLPHDTLSSLMTNIVAYTKLKNEHTMQSTPVHLQRLDNITKLLSVLFSYIAIIEDREMLRNKLVAYRQQ